MRKLTITLTNFLTSITIMFTSACASPSNNIFHGFDFGIPGENGGVKILDYRYDRNLFPSPDRVAAGNVGQSDGTSGNMPIGKFVYVRWLGANGEKEQRVELLGRLPANMHNKQIHFDIFNDSLRIFVISVDTKRSASDPVCAVAGYALMKCAQIFP